MRQRPAIVAGTVGHTLYMGDVQLRSQVLGAVLGLGGAVIGYYFGSSSGSAQKNQLLAEKVPE